jgi:hypothetical protein
MSFTLRPVSKLAHTRTILEQKGYQTIKNDKAKVTMPPGFHYDRVAALFLHGAPLPSALFLTLVSPAEIIQKGRDVIIVGDPADLTCEQVGEIIKEETTRGPQRSDPDEEIAVSLPNHFRITLPSID